MRSQTSMQHAEQSSKEGCSISLTVWKRFCTFPGTWTLTMAVQAWKWAFGVGWDRKPWLGWAGEWAFWLSIGLWGLVLRFSERFDFIFTRKHQTPVTTGENCHFSSSGLVNHNFVQLCRSWIRTIRTIRSRTIQMAVFLEKSSFSRKLRIWPMTRK